MAVSAGHLPLDDDEVDAMRFEDRERKRRQSRGCVCGLPGCFGVHECSYREDDESSEERADRLADQFVGLSAIAIAVFVILLTIGGIA